MDRKIAGEQQGGCRDRGRPQLGWEDCLERDLGRAGEGEKLRATARNIENDGRQYQQCDLPHPYNVQGNKNNIPWQKHNHRLCSLIENQTRTESDHVIFTSPETRRNSSRWQHASAYSEWGQADQWDNVIVLFIDWHVESQRTAKGQPEAGELLSTSESVPRYVQEIILG